MKLPRRKFLHLTASAATLAALPRIACSGSACSRSACSGSAWAQTYPSRPVRVVATFAAGGGSDITARLIGQWVSERLGQPFIIENRPGGGGNIGTEAVVNARPDGYTLLLAGAFNAVNATLYDKLNFNFIRDIAPVAGTMLVPNVMVVNPSVPAKTIPEFIAHAKANPGKLSMASGGIATPGHVFGELFKMMTGINMTLLPYRGGASVLTDLLAGQVQVCFYPTPAAIEYIRASKLRALAVTTGARSEAPSQATRRARGKASARPRTRRLRSSTSSTTRSTQPSRTPI